MVWGSKSDTLNKDTTPKKIPPPWQWIDNAYRELPDIQDVAKRSGT